MRRLLILAALFLVLAFPTPAKAAVYTYLWHEGTCTQLWHAQGDPVPFLCATENINHAGAKLVLTGSSDIADLGNVSHPGGDLCSPHRLPPDNFNDCISAVWVKLGTNDSFCLHSQHSYAGDLVWWAAAPSSPSGGVWTYSTTELNPNDTTSSIRLQQSGTDCPYL